MVRISVLSTLALLMAVPGAVNAAPCNGKRCVSQIDRLYVNSSGDVLIRPKDRGQENLNCTPNTGVYLSLPKSTPGFKEIYSALLSATLSKRVVNMRIVTGSSNCAISYVMLDN